MPPGKGGYCASSCRQALSGIR
ncbi:Undecaprenyl-phosphate N-acetylglucosaminyl 1-phosphate transferase [Pseudomonas sp. XWY-1]|nr:Undecaprenyl-phosphate N-acetylglucosaminyl 1-phosphate transferase [Pseudomonas sp. XWY-1]